jgi:chromosome segregation ATPase
MNQQTIVPRHNGEALASLGKLEDRIQSTIELLRNARRKEASTDEEILRLKERLVEKDRELQRLAADLAEYRSEREQVRQRVETLLEQIEELAE